MLSNVQVLQVLGSTEGAASIALEKPTYDLNQNLSLPTNEFFKVFRDLMAEHTAFQFRAAENEVLYNKQLNLKAEEASPSLPTVILSELLNLLKVHEEKKLSEMELSETDENNPIQGLSLSIPFDLEQDLSSQQLQLLEKGSEMSLALSDQAMKTPVSEILKRSEKSDPQLTFANQSTTIIKEFNHPDTLASIISMPVNDDISTGISPSLSDQIAFDKLPSSTDLKQDNLSTSSALPRAETNNTNFKPMQVLVPIQHKTWTDEFNQQVVWISGQHIKSAAIQLNPPELGPIQVNIDVVKDTTVIHFVSHSSQVREMIEQSLPRLREMMSSSDINVVNVDVSDRQPQHPQGGEYFAKNTSYHSGSNEDKQNTDGTRLVTPIRKNGSGLVDFSA